LGKSDITCEGNGTLETLLNIYCNGSEIFGKSLGLGFLLGAISLLFLKEKTNAIKLAIAGVLYLLWGLSTIPLVQWLAANSPSIILGAFSVLACLFLLCAVLIGYFLPTLVAFKRSKPNKKLLLILNIFLGLLPLGWNIVLFISFKKDKQPSLTM
jgi:hypothetical protein